MRDDDKMLELPPDFGSGIVGVCDICGTRQAVIILSKERFKLCVVDFLNKTWIKTTQKPGAPLPPYRSERVWFPTDTTATGKAPGVLLSPTKPIKRPGLLVTPDVYGITTSTLDGAIRCAREGFEVFLPDVAKTEGVGPGHHVALRGSVRIRGGVHTTHKKIDAMTSLYEDALAALRARELVDPTKTGLLGVSYGASLAMALAARDQRLGAVVLAYPMPVRPDDLPRLITAPTLYLGGTDDRSSARARSQLAAAQAQARVPVEFVDLPRVRHDFLSRDLAAYDLRAAEFAWGAAVAFLKRTLMPAPPRPPPVPSPPAAAPAPPAKPAATA